MFAGYTVIRLVGSGGMGEVYLVEHPRLPRRDALKILGTDVSADEEYRQRFIREADLAAGLWHPNIVRMNDRGEFNGQLWISMDYVDGTDAARLVRDRYPAGMPEHDVSVIVTAVAGALDYAHQRGLLHRDVKPANILLTKPDDQGERRILLADFGIARQLADISGLTATNLTVGTVAYAAPEQLMGADIDGRADQYALAASAFHLLTGAPPYQHSNPVAVISQHLNAALPTLADSRPELARLDPVLAVGLAKDRDDRFTRCADFARALAQQITAAGPSATAPTAPAPTARKAAASTQGVLRAGTGRAATRGPRRWLLAAAVLAVILVAGGLALAWHPWRHRQLATSATSTAAPPPTAPPGTPAATAAPPSAEKAATQTITIVAVANGQPASGYREVPNTNSVPQLFECDMPAEGAVTPNIYACYPNSSGADVCWPSPPASLLCLNDPWDKELRRFSFDTGSLPAVQPVSNPSPLAVLLDDGTRCRIMTGGARGGRPDRLIPAYRCGETDSALSILMGPNDEDPFDRSQPLWTARVADAGASPQTRTVITAWFAGN